MKIKSLTITEPEMLEAVNAFLRTHGVSVPATKCEQVYSHHDYFTCTFDLPEPVKPYVAGEPIDK